MRYEGLGPALGVSSSCLALLGLVLTLGTTLASGAAAVQPTIGRHESAAVGLAAGSSEPMPGCNAPADLGLAGPQAGIGYTFCSFAASVTPLTATVLGCNALQGVELLGPPTGSLGIANTFTATVRPVTATVPVTYTWEATEQPTLSERSGLSHTATFTWAVTGTQVVTVTAVNTCSAAIEMTTTVDIASRQVRVFLPVVQRENIQDPCEPNNSIGDACGPLKSGQRYYAYILEDTGEDYYYFDISTTRPIDVQLAVPLAWDLDLYIYTYDPTLKEVGRSHFTGCGKDEAVSFEPQSTGRYYIRVYPYPFTHCTGTEPYSLLATFD